MHGMDRDDQMSNLKPVIGQLPPKPDSRSIFWQFFDKKVQLLAMGAAGKEALKLMPKDVQGSNVSVMNISSMEGDCFCSFFWGKQRPNLHNIQRGVYLGKPGIFGWVMF